MGCNTREENAAELKHEIDRAEMIGADRIEVLYDSREVLSYLIDRTELPAEVHQALLDGDDELFRDWFCENSYRYDPKAYVVDGEGILDIIEGK